MKKVLYCSTLACCLLGLTGCVQSQKRVATSIPEQGYEQQSVQQGAGVYTGPSSPQSADGTVITQQPRYLDISDGQELTIEQVTTETVIPSMDYINDRIFEYGRKLDRWKELDNQSLTVNLSQEDTEQMVRCFRSLQNVLNGYTQLQEDILQSRRVSGNGEVSGSVMQELQKNDIDFIDSPCGRLLASTEDKAAGWGQREQGADLAQLETLIGRYAGNQEYEEVVQVWLQIPENQIDRIDLQTKLHYGNALMYLHQEEQAAKMYQQIVDQMSASEEQSTDLISLRKVLADLYTASSNYPAAEEQYKKISQDYIRLGEIEEWSKLQLSILERSLKGSPELTEYSGLLRNFLGFIPEKDGYKIVWQAEEFLLNYPYSAVSSNVDIIKAQAMQRADAWMSGFMGKVDQLAAEKKYQEAIEILDSIPMDLVNAEKQGTLKIKKDDLVLGEAVDRETNKLAQVQELQRQWNSGMLLVKGERFDEAIALFTEMLDTEYRVKAGDKIAEVSLLAAKSERRKAADVFIRFTKTTDLESQKKLLLESRKMLKDILIKYPDVEIAEKVRGNIERVEQEMNTLDPTMLQMADNDMFQDKRQQSDAFDANINSMPLPGSEPAIVEDSLMQ
jgi:tetratricopeptide (TPR) repeat protein